MSAQWMPIYVGDYYANTMHLSATEHGAFMLLAMHHWQNGCLPSDDAQLASIARMKVSSWLELKDVILDLFERKSFWDGRTVFEKFTGIGRKEWRPAIPKSVRDAVFERDGFACVYCGDERGPFDLDHKIPYSRGGEHTIENLTVACRTCNRSKGALTTEEWL